MRQLTRKKPSNMGVGVVYVIDLMQKLYEPLNYTSLAHAVKIKDRGRYQQILRWGKETNLITKNSNTYVLSLNGRAFLSVLEELPNA